MARLGMVTRYHAFHITWGTGPGVVAPFAERVLEAAKTGLISLKFRHQVDELIVDWWRSGLECVAPCWNPLRSSVARLARV